MADIREKTPVAKKASAGGKGHNGAALATVFLQEDERSAREAIRIEGSMKDRLKKLLKLTEPDHVEFRATLEETRAAIRARANDAKLSQQDYYKSGTVQARVDASLNASVSLWQKMSTAAQNGFNPDYSMGWNDLSQKATEYNKSRGSTSPAAGNGRNPTPILDKTKNFVKATIKGADGKVKEEMLAAQPVKIGSATVMQIPLVESIMLMLSMADAPDEVCDHLIEKVQQFKKDRATARDAAKAAADKAAAKPTTPTANPGTPAPETAKPQAQGKVAATRKIIRKPRATA